jgi:hypothetical protein
MRSTPFQHNALQIFEQFARYPIAPRGQRFHSSNYNRLAPSRSFRERSQDGPRRWGLLNRRRPVHRGINIVNYFP